MLKFGHYNIESDSASFVVEKGFLKLFSENRSDRSDGSPKLSQSKTE